MSITESPEQTGAVAPEEMDAIGDDIWVTCRGADCPLQPCALVTVSVYVPVELTVMVAEVAPFDHR